MCSATSALAKRLLMERKPVVIEGCSLVRSGSGCCGRTRAVYRRRDRALPRLQLLVRLVIERERERHEEQRKRHETRASKPKSAQAAAGVWLGRGPHARLQRVVVVLHHHTLELLAAWLLPTRLLRAWLPLC